MNTGGRKIIMMLTLMMMIFINIILPIIMMTRLLLPVIMMVIIMLMKMKTSALIVCESLWNADRRENAGAGGCKSMLPYQDQTGSCLDHGHHHDENYVFPIMVRTTGQR